MSRGDRIGIIADDLTGGADVGGLLQQAGHRVVLVPDVPSQHVDVEDATAVVVALKTRTAPVEAAIDESLAALQWLKSIGASRFYFKYCSTFDSTPSGNIGPVADALSESLGQEHTCFVPSYPQNGRTVYGANLFVKGQRLDESSMATHPVTPMTNANLTQVLAPQTHRHVKSIGLDIVRQGYGALETELDRFSAGDATNIIIDAIEISDLHRIAATLDSAALATGGAALAGALYRTDHLTPHQCTATSEARPLLVIAGSCSAVTRSQVHAAKDVMSYKRVDPIALANGGQATEALVAWVLDSVKRGPTMLYSSASPSEVVAAQALLGKVESSRLVESTLAAVTARVMAVLPCDLVVAGGETAGAVIRMLGIASFLVGREMTPGVPWLHSISEPPLDILLKSGGFGGELFLFELATRGDKP